MATSRRSCGNFQSASLQTDNHASTAPVFTGGMPYLPLIQRCQAFTIMIITLLTSGQSTLTKSLHCHCTWTIQSYSPGGTNVHPSNTCYLGRTCVHIPYDIVFQPFVHRSWQRALHFTTSLHFPSKNCLFAAGSRPPSNTWFLLPNLLVCN